MNTRREFLAKLFGVLGLSAIASRFAPNIETRPVVRHDRSSLREAFNKSSIYEWDISDPGHRHSIPYEHYHGVCDPGHSHNINEPGLTPSLFQQGEITRDMSQMDFLRQASGRPKDAPPWQNERIVPRGRPSTMKRGVFKDFYYTDSESA